MATEYADILLTLDGDLDLSTNDIQLTQTNLQSLRQRLALRFEVWSGGQDWLYNTTFGTPWRSYIGKAVAKSAIDAEIRRQILLEPDVDSITSFISVIISDNVCLLKPAELRPLAKEISYLVNPIINPRGWA